MKNKKTTSAAPSGQAAGRQRIHWGWTLVLTFGLAALAILGLLEMRGSMASGLIREPLSGSFHVSLLLLATAIGLVVLDFVLWRTKGR